MKTGMEKTEREHITYSKAGVDIERGDRFARFITRIQSSAVSKGIGGFAGGIEIDTNRYKTPVLYSTTDGVGTKLKVASALEIYNTIGIDLVAMCVNDLIVSNVEPLTFLDYIACGSLNEDILSDVVHGIVVGCEEAGCMLTGGETAEMPDMYSESEFDLAGFCTGIGEKKELLPHKDKIQPGDMIFGLPSSGIHSNGFSLVRKVIPVDDKALMKTLLTPTKIYVQEMKKLLSTGKITAAAHITGGGLEGNIQRVLPKGMRPELQFDWPVPSIFNEIENLGPISPEEMRRVFNMGVGIAFVVKRGTEEELLATAEKNDIKLFNIGVITDG
jgi:phosphoribosylformylglycinamidine cyclo-ligase